MSEKKTECRPRLNRRSMLVILTSAAGSVGRMKAETLSLMKEMEVRYDITIFTRHDQIHRSWRGGRVLARAPISGPSISPDGRAMCWCLMDPLQELRDNPFLTVDSLNGGIRPIHLVGKIAVGLSICSGAMTIVAHAQSLDVPQDRSLFVLDLRDGLKVSNVSRSVTTFDLRDEEGLSISGAGTLAAIGSREQMQVLELPSGNPVYSGVGRFPRLSPDGRNLAFIRGERLYLRTLFESSEIQLLGGKRVMGIGGWSPDGRFLLAGAWTKLLAFEKRQIVIDTRTGRFAELGRLGEGDYGNLSRWISKGLMAQSSGGISGKC